MSTNLLVRNIDESLFLALKQRAATHGRSVEAEHREILQTVLQGPLRRSLAEVLASMPAVGEESDFEFRHQS
jgi:plasmid stability protein